MILQTQRLYLREFTPEDLDDLHALNSDPEVMRYISRLPAQKLAESEQFIRHQLGYYLQHPGMGIFPAFTKEGQKFVGFFLLLHVADSDAVELGYRFLKEEWGKGYATEGAKAVLAYAQQTLRLPNIVAFAHPENSASQRVLEKSGFGYAGNSMYAGRVVRYYKPL